MLIISELAAVQITGKCKSAHLESYHRKENKMNFPSLAAHKYKEWENFHLHITRIS